MKVMTVNESRKLLGAFAIGVLVCVFDGGRMEAQLANTSQSSSQNDRTAAAKIEVKLSEYKIDMPTTAPAGNTSFQVTNTGKELHNFEIEGNGIEKRVGELTPGETKTLLVELKAGKYEVYCPVPGHKSHGMSLDLAVR